MMLFVGNVRYVSHNVLQIHFDKIKLVKYAKLMLRVGVFELRRCNPGFLNSTSLHDIIWAKSILF